MAVSMAAAVTEVPFDLLEAKLAAPPTRPGSVAKTDVIARLCAASVPFATVVAPAGYGKLGLDEVERNFRDGGGHRDGPC